MYYTYRSKCCKEVSFVNFLSQKSTKWQIDSISLIIDNYWFINTPSFIDLSLSVQESFIIGGGPLLERGVGAIITVCRMVR